MDIIKINNFSKKYKIFEAVKGISIKVEQGEIVGFVGKNGAGKSTTLRSMLNIINPTSGSIKIFDLDSVTDAKEIKKNVSYVPSETVLYDNLTAKEILKFAASFNKNNIYNYEDLANHFELPLNKKIKELSLGNKKKVALIQALIKDAKLIILDEPTSGLDPLIQQKFFELLLERKEKGTTIFMSSHNLSEIEKYCDKVVIIKDGLIVDYMNVEDIKSRAKQIVTYTTRDNKTYSYEIKKDINVLLKQLRSFDLISLEIRNKTVEEEFIDYYKEDTK